MLNVLPKINIIALIEKDSKTRLNKDYQNSLINKIKGAFNAEEQQLFVASFYCYLNYNTKTDFAIDFTDVWKWCGFGRKQEAKRLLERHFIEDIDYKVENFAAPIGAAKTFTEDKVENFAPAISGAKSSEEDEKVSSETKEETRGGYNKEKITLTVNTFKKFCMKAGTKKSDQIHDYYVKLEEILQETLKEQTDELQNQLEQKTKEVQEKSQALSNEQSLVISLKKSHAKLVEKNHFYYNFREMPCVYILSNPDIPIKKFKIGYTDNMNIRLKADRTMAPNLRVEFLMYTPHAVLFEKLIKTKYRRKLEALNHEWVVEYLENLIKFYRDINTLMEFDGIEEINVWQYNLDHDPVQGLQPAAQAPVLPSEEKSNEVIEESPKPRETVKSVVKFNLDLKEDVLQERLKKLLPYFLTKTDYIEKNKKAPAGKRYCNAFCRDYVPLENFMISAKGVIPLCKACQDLEDKCWIKINKGELTEQQIRENPLLISCSTNEKICRICNQVRSLDQFEAGKHGDRVRRQCKPCRRQMDQERAKSFDIEASSKKILEMTEKVEQTPLKDFVNLYPKDRLTQIIKKLEIGRRSDDKKSDMVEKVVTFFIDFQKNGRSLDVFFAEKE